jgi:hypothetical protein
MGDSMSSMVLSGDTSGTVTVTVPAVAGTNTVTIPASTGTVMVSGNMPAFSAYLGVAQNGISANTATKVQYAVKEYDTASCYNNSTYVFTPNVAGYYQVNGNVQWNTNAAGSKVTIYKNGSAFKQGALSNGANTSGASVSATIYMNGSTDYLEMYITSNLANGIEPSSVASYFQAIMVRAA